MKKYFFPSALQGHLYTILFDYGAPLKQNQAIMNEALNHNRVKKCDKAENRTLFSEMYGDAEK